MKRTRQTRIGFSVLGVTLLLAGCGGRVIDDSGAGGLAPSGQTASQAGSAGKGGKSTGTASLPASQLPECVPGFSRSENPTRPCRWLSEAGQCFDTTEEACACICPIDHQSVCAHGFDGGPNDAKPIFCE